VQSDGSVRILGQEEFVVWVVTLVAAGEAGELGTPIES
jgi:hypothetical protein